MSWKEYYEYKYNGVTPKYKAKLVLKAWDELDLDEVGYKIVMKWFRTASLAFSLWAFFVGMIVMDIIKMLW